MDGQYLRRAAVVPQYEQVYLNAYASLAEAKAGIGAWFGFHNEERQHQSLSYRAPRQAQGSTMPVDTGTTGFVDRLRLGPHPHRHNHQPQDQY